MATKRAWLAILLMFNAGTASAQSFDKTVLAWSLPWDADWVTAVRFIGSNRIAAGNNLGQIMIWDLPEKKGGPAPNPVRRFDGHTNAITRLLTSVDGRYLISASNDRTIRLWDTQATADKKGVVTLNARAIQEAETRKKKTPKANEVVVEVQEGGRIFGSHGDWVVGLSLNADGTLMASGDEKGEIIVWDFPSGKERKRWKAKGWVYALALAPDGQTLLASERLPLVFDSGRHAGLKLWNVGTGEMKADLSKAFDKQMFSAAAFSADGKHLAIGRGGEIDGLNGKVLLLDPATGKLKKELTPGHLNGITNLIFHPGGKHLLSCGRDTTIRVWDVEQGKLVKELGQGRGGQFKDWIHDIAISPDSKWIAGADMAGFVQIYGSE